jgi:catechol 2,3-dioxygenase-like lactoylglutathione lyase family enzyme
VPSITGFLYVGLSVRDVPTSSAWYAKLLGLRTLRESVGADGREGEVLLRDQHSGLLLGLLAHRSNPGDAFSEFRTGLDHIEFGVASRDELEKWVAILDDLGISHSGIKDCPSSALVTFRDPDNIQLEFYWPK